MLTYKKSGSGPTLVYLHGLFGDKDNLAFFTRKLQGYTHILMDLPCHGESPNPTSLSYPEMAREVLETAAQLTDEPITIIGHSMGGRVAMECALSNPQSIDAMIILDIGPLGGPPRHESIFQTILNLETGGGIPREKAVQILDQQLKNLMISRFVGKSLKDDGSGGCYWAYGLEGLSNSWDSLWESLELQRKFEKPVLVLSGENSDYVDKRALKAMNDLFPSMISNVIPGSGHWLHAENPEEVLLRISDFLRK